MNLTLLLDMNISPGWVSLLHKDGLGAVHWSSVGKPSATDEMVMAYARTHGHTLITHDLDFTHLLALTHAAGPSVVLLRRQLALSEREAVSNVAKTILQHESILASGALMVIDAARFRVRTLPFNHADD